MVCICSSSRRGRRDAVAAAARESARPRRDAVSAQADAAKKWTDEKWAREEGKRQRGSRQGMVDEDARSALMRQALNELEAQYDAVGAFSVTVDAHKAVRDVTQVFYEEDRQVLLTEVEKGFELRPESSTRRLLDGVAITRLTG